jgi:hypothetical protein
LDTESSEVQDILNDKKANVVATKNAALKAQMNVLDAQENVTYSNLDDKAGTMN